MAVTSFSLFDLCIRSELTHISFRQHAIRSPRQSMVDLTVSRKWIDWNHLGSHEWTVTGFALDGENRVQLAGLRNHSSNLIASHRGLYFLNEDLTEVSFRPFRGSTIESWKNSIINVLAGRQQLAGYTTLHGNALSIFDRGVVLFGASGSGKSTLTAALVARGAKVVSEDITCLVPGLKDAALLPGPAAIRLSSKTATLMGLEGRVAKSVDQSEKDALSSRRFPEFFVQEAIPLSIGYQLHRQPEDVRNWDISITSSTPQQTLLGLLRSCLALYLLDPLSQAEVLGRIGHLSRKFPMRDICYGSSFERLSEVCSRIETDVMNL